MKVNEFIKKALEVEKLPTLYKLGKFMNSYQQEKIQEIEKDYKVEMTKSNRDALVRSGLLSIKEIDSEQIIEDWLEAKSKGITIEEFINVYGEFKDKFTDRETYTKLKKRLRTLRK